MAYTAADVGPFNKSGDAPRILQYMISCEAGANMIMTSDTNIHSVVTYTIVERVEYYLLA